MGGAELDVAVLPVGLISIHPPRGGWDSLSVTRVSPSSNFNPPTPWGVGPRNHPAHPAQKYFNPPTPWGVGPDWSRRRSPCTYFNPPTPWGVGLIFCRARGMVALFQSTHPVGGGTPRPPGPGFLIGFQSTHPVGGGTCMPCPPRFMTPDFNPPTPWGVGLLSDFFDPAKPKFQSTHPVGGGTRHRSGSARLAAISIHPPRGGWDSSALASFSLSR